MQSLKWVVIQLVAPEHRCCVCGASVCVPLHCLFYSYRFIPTWSASISFHTLSARRNGERVGKRRNRHTHARDLYGLRVRLRLCKQPAIFAHSFRRIVKPCRISCVLRPPGFLHFDLSNRTVTPTAATITCPNTSNWTYTYICRSLLPLLIKLIYHRAPYKRANVVICHTHLSV